MKVQVKKQDCNNISFDARIKAIIFGIGSLAWQEKMKLYHDVVRECRVQVGDCVDAMLIAEYIALHDNFGFGKTRIHQLDECVQPIIDETVDKYDIGTVYKLRRDLEERGYKYVLHTERRKR